MMFWLIHYTSIAHLSIVQEAANVCVISKYTVKFYFFHNNLLRRASARFLPIARASHPARTRECTLTSTVALGILIDINGKQQTKQ